MTRMSRDLTTLGIDLEQLPVETAPLHALDEDALAEVFAKADRVAASSFFWACACVEEFRVRYSQHGRYWYRVLAERLGRSVPAIGFYLRVWRLYEAIRQDSALSSRVEAFTFLPRGVLTRLAQVKDAKRVEAASLVLDEAAEGRAVGVRQVQRFLEGRGLLSPGRQKRWVFGPPLNFRELRHEPVNELGVVYLFGMVARELGFLVEGVADQFPDCTAKRLVKQDRYVPVRIEFEFQSRTFVDHGHDTRQCDLIVCWEDNWPECPLEVLDLKSRIGQMGSNDQ